MKRNAIALDGFDISDAFDIDYNRTDELIAELRVVDTMIISDIHLGSEVSRSKDCLKMLQQHTFKRLILNGDVFEDLNFKRLTKADWKFLSYIRKLSNPKRGVEVVWVAGNHDGIAEILSHLIGCPVYDEYIWEEDGKRYLAIHGHQFDRFLEENVIVSAIACGFYKIFQRLDTDKQRVSRWMKRRSKIWLRVSEKIAHDAIAYARTKNCEVVFCGHTHQAIEYEENGIRYRNSGCWTDVPSHYITLDRFNDVQIRDQG